MFKGHPKGLYVLFFTEMWERFGFYTMLAIFVFYLGENFGWPASRTTEVYGIFLAGVYLTPILGGWLADNFLGYGRTIIIGAITMGVGYAMMAAPTSDPMQVYIALGVVALGNGLFKANISVLVGNLYSHTQNSLKDAGYNIFYMGINVGAFYAPFAASGIKNFFLDNFNVTLAVGYNAGFGLAAFGMLMSLLIFVIFRKHYKSADYTSKKQTNPDVDQKLTPQQEKQRIGALLIIFAIVIFFWMAFHQNGAALSLFAKDYIHGSVGPWTYMLFDVIGLHALLITLMGLIGLINPKIQGKLKMVSAAAVIIGAIVMIYKYNSFDGTNNLDPEKFQIFNPMFIVFITPIIVGFFAYLNKKGKEPSSPAKIGIGMVITGLAYCVMVFASMNLPGVYTLGEGSSAMTISPFWLIGTYFTLTIAELFLSPMGLSFVSKVSPAKIKGLMMGGWFLSTAIGNYLSGFVGRFYQDWELWQFFLLLVATSVAAALMLLSVLKRLKRATQ
ncbi:MAG: peptide MFS transporter [Candidatus Kapaibacterium sp.]